MYKFALLILSFVLCSCQSLHSRGMFIENDKIAEIKSAKLSKEKLLALLGEPTLQPDYSTDTWYYVSRTVQNKTWSKPYIKKQRVVKIIFKDNHVSNVEVIDNQHKNIDTTKDHTALQGNDESSIQSFVKNFGRFNKTSRSKRR